MVAQGENKSVTYANDDDNMSRRGWEGRASERAYHYRVHDKVRESQSPGYTRSTDQVWDLLCNICS